MSDNPMDGAPPWAAHLLSEIQQTRADILARIDRLHERVEGHADDLKVNPSATQIGHDKAREARREVETLTDMVFAMQRRILALDTAIREMREGR